MIRCGIAKADVAAGDQSRDDLAMFQLPIASATLVPDAPGVGVGGHTSFCCCTYITRYLLFFGIAVTAFCTYSMGSHETLRTLPKSPRRLRILAKACSSRKLHIHCAAPRGVRVDQRLAGEITGGTSKNITFIMPKP